MIKKLYSFDGTDNKVSDVYRPDRYHELYKILNKSTNVIIRGGGLSYCNAGCSDLTVLNKCFNRIEKFDEEAGLIVVEAGITIGDLTSIVTKKGWYFPVLPGHPSITIGGCLSFNVHGKSQHNVGNFIDYVEYFILFHPTHGEIMCSKEINPEIFFLTVGGLGLTGYIVKVGLKLLPFKSSQISLQRVKVKNISEAVRIMHSKSIEIDTLFSWHNLNLTNKNNFGKGIVYLENFIESKEELKSFHFNNLSAEKRRLVIGYDLMNKLTTQLQTRLYYFIESLKDSNQILNFSQTVFPINGKEIYFYLFGKKGFREYQMILPFEVWDEAIEEIRILIKQLNIPITLGSLKVFKGNETYLNFCKTGVCLTLDVQMIYTDSFFVKLDAIVIKYKGIVNLSKDSRLDSKTVETIFPEYQLFKEKIYNFDKKRIFTSELSNRINV